MRLDQPQLLNWLWIIPVLVWGWFLLRRFRQKQMARFVSVELFGELINNFNWLRQAAIAKSCLAQFFHGLMSVREYADAGRRPITTLTL